MTSNPRCTRAILALTTVVILGAAGLALAQTTTAPINTGPNPYKSIDNWAKLPDGRTWIPECTLRLGAQLRAQQGARHPWDVNSSSESVL